MQQEVAFPWKRPSSKVLQPISTKILPSLPIGCFRDRGFPALVAGNKLNLIGLLFCLQAVIVLVRKDYSKKNVFKSGQQSFPVIASPWYRVVRCVSREDKPYKEQSLRRTGFRAGGVSSSLKIASLNLCKTVH